MKKVTKTSADLLVGNNKKTTKVHLLIFFILIQSYGFSQSLEERKKVTSEFEKSSDANIELFNINSVSKQFDSIQLTSDFLKRKNINYKILGFRISGVDKNGGIIFFLKSWSNKIPKEFKQKFNNCSKCKSVKIDGITINWFTGTYTLNASRKWNIR